LQALGEAFQIRRVCDPIQERAEQEAGRLGCAAALGPTELLESEEVEAVLLLPGPWYRLWPVEAACRFGKPVFCAALLEHDDRAADVQRLVRDSRLPVMMAFPARTALATQRLRQLLEGPLGAPRLLLCSFAVPPAAVAWSVPLDLLDWCTSLLPGEPATLLAAGGGDRALVSLFLEWSDGGVVQLTGRRVGAAGTRCRLEVVAERGSATVELPDRVTWTAPDGRHWHRLRPARPGEELLLEAFHQALQQGRSLQPSLDDASRLLTWLGLADRSRQEGRRLSVPPVEAETPAADAS
jgi:predicted dehydrogenase